ncbi:sigma-70 family RNA polymerase sigma factor [Polystyrenella longa]|nr:sigma-70 family RNA polymerase sigma factor [Polystyrenella longa]
MTPAEQEYFVQQITAHQPMLHGYIRSLIPDGDRASDVLQETNLVLWRRADEFTMGENFGGWARKVAYFQILAFYRDHQREKLLFNADLVSAMAEQSEQQFSQQKEWQTALQHCLQKLPNQQRLLIQQRYLPGSSVQRLADEMDRPVGSVSQSLYRIREVLRNCIHSQLRTDSGEITL